MPHADLSSLVYTYLKTNADAADVRALLVGGADSVLEVGFVTASLLATNRDARRASPANKALALSVQDAGQTPRAERDLHNQYVIVRVYDQGMGYRNIRLVKEELLDILRGAIDVLELGSHGLLNTRFAGRTGYRRDLNLNVDYEALTFVGIVQELELD